LISIKDLESFSSHLAARNDHRDRTREGPAVAHNQDKVFAFLQDPRSHGNVAAVNRIDTHSATVFLAGPDVYKVKRNVVYPFLDFSTLEKRRAACEAEVEVNKGNAPDIYLGVVPISYDGKAYRFGKTGEVVEWAVHMRRFDETATLDRVAEKAELGRTLVDKLARVVARSHERAPKRVDVTRVSRLRAILTETVQELQDAAEVFGGAAVAAYGVEAQLVFDRVEPLLVRRAAEGQVRRCHGDLHLGNIALIGEEPVLFDAIEFSENIATCDVLYDFAFVLMDLWERGRRIDANGLLNRYLLLCGGNGAQIEGLAALPLFLSLRAAIRAKVLVALLRLNPSAEGRRREAVAYFRAARRFIAPVAPRLVAVGGFSGAGKSALSAVMAPALGCAPGALHLRSDVERKRIFGVDETVRLGAEAYRPEISRQVYGRLREGALQGVRAGQSVIVDATHSSRGDRDAIADVAADAGVPFIGIWLDAPQSLLTARVEARRGDASDATSLTVRAQLKQGTGDIAWPRLDAAQPLETLARLALQLAGAARRPVVAVAPAPAD
jgi:uncharacterized protein